MAVELQLAVSHVSAKMISRLELLHCAVKLELSEVLRRRFAWENPCQ